MAVNWSLGQQPNALAMMMQGFEAGQERKRQEGVRNALGTLVQNPMDQGAFGTLAQNAPELALQFRGQQQTQQAKQAEGQQQQLIQMGRLLNNAQDETTYQQSLAAARQIGIDTSRAPANFDPNWVAQQKTVLSAFEKDGGQQISGLARELQDAGYQPGTPAFQQAMTVALQGKYAPQYTDQQGNLRQARLPSLPQPGQVAQPAQPAKITSFEAASQAAQQMGPQFPDFVRNNGFRVQVTTPQQAMQLPSGTPLILPDGSEGVVP